MASNTFDGQMFGSLKRTFDATAVNAPGVRDLGIAEISAMILNIVMGLGFGISIVAIAFSAVQFVLSRGEPDSTKLASDSLLFGVIAAVVSVLLLTIRSLILKNILGVTLDGVAEGVPDL